LNSEEAAGEMVSVSVSVYMKREGKREREREERNPDESFFLSRYVFFPPSQRRIRA